MRFFSSQKPNREGAEVAQVPNSQEPYDETELEKSNSVTGVAASSGNNSDGKENITEELPENDLQDGVKKAEVVTLVWTKNSLVVLYICIFLVFFVNSLQQQVTNNLTAYVTSDFSEHALVSVTSTLSSIIGGVCKLPIGKAIDLWGRAEGFAAMTVIATLGLVMMAACHNVQTYAAAQVFYWVGFNGIAYVLDVVMADTSSLKNRAILFAFSTTPYIATTFAGPAIAQDFYLYSNFRWAFGAFAIITPVIMSPILAILFMNQREAKKQGLLVLEKSERTFVESCVHHFWEFDLAGILLVCAGFVLFLLPFSLAATTAGGWTSATILCMLIFGILTLILFALYEKFLSPKPFIPFHLLLDPSVMGACGVACTLFITFYIWDTYFYSWLQVVHNESIRNAGYISNIYSIGSCFFSVIVGISIRMTGRFKWLAWSAIPLLMLGSGLMIHFRGDDSPIGYVIMCQIFIAFAGGTLVITEEMEVMAAAPHAGVAAMLALIGLFSSVGGAIGAAISGAIWSNTVPEALIAALPEGSKDLASSIYASLVVAEGYPVGGAIRDAIDEAYGVAQRRLTIAATCFIVLLVPFVWMWRDFRVKELRQVRGRVV